jgi:HTH-type transcriptional regulator, transcriptional repressor of NAD biosynthesis genes
MTTGFLLGKFLPPHVGHAYLIDFARSFCDELTVLVCSIPSEPIPGAVRFEAMRQHFGGVRVLHCTEDLPQAPEDDPENFWAIWREVCLSRLERAPDFVFASEPYGAHLSEELGGRFIPVDIARAAQPISGTRIREDPWAHWDKILPEARGYFLKRVALVGPESAGKTTLAEKLAAHFQTVHAPEYARGYIDALGPHWTDDAFVSIARGQRASQDALALDARRFLFSDTDALTTTLWARELLGHVPPEVKQLADSERYDLTLLCAATETWKPDPQRFQPELQARRDFEARLTAELKRQGRAFVKLTGSHDQRFSQAIDALENLPVGSI